MRPTLRLLAGLLLGLGLAPAARAAAPTPAAPGGQPVSKGAVVSVDLSRLPSRVERRGRGRCQRPFTFDAPVEGDPMVLVFQPSGGGPPTRVEIPYERTARPRTFTAPSAGTLSTERPVAARPPAPAAAKGDQAPPGLPPVQAERALAAAALACGDCRGAPAFKLMDYTLEAVPPSSQEVVIDIRQPTP